MQQPLMAAESLPDAPTPTRVGARRLVVVAAILILAFLLHIGIGSTLWMRPWDIVAEIFRGNLGGSGDNDNLIIWQLRLPRALGCVLVGGILGSVGAAFQALFRNPLAEPYVVGVSGGAAVGGCVALVLGFSGAIFGLAGLACAFAGGLSSLMLVIALARRRGVISVPGVLLAGVVVGSLLAALLSLLLIAAGRDTNQLFRWLLGYMGTLFWPHIAVLCAFLIIGLAILMRDTRRLNAFSVSEASAQQLGVDTGRLRTRVLVTGTAMVAAAVGTVGIIGFLGLVAPHISRRLLGIDLRRSLLGSALLGSVLLLAADLMAQRIIPGIELPVGAVCALLGAPSLLLILGRSER